MALGIRARVRAVLVRRGREAQLGFSVGGGVGNGRRIGERDGCAGGMGSF